MTQHTSIFHYTALSLTLIVCLLASNVAFAKNDRIGFVNVSIVMQKAPQAKKAKSELEEEFSERDGELSRLDKKIEKLKAQLNDDSKKLTASKRSKIKKNITATQRDLRDKREEIREEFSERRREELGKLQKLIYEVVVKMAKDKKIDLVVTEPVLYASDRVNLTDDVIKVLEKRAK